jgi:hypothetical protein
MKRFVHLGFNSGPTLTIFYRAALEKFLNQNADDWFRISSENYILWTDRDLGSLTQVITELPGFKHFTVFASVFSPEAYTANGMMPKEFWAWLQKWRSVY